MANGEGGRLAKLDDTAQISQSNGRSSSVFVSFDVVQLSGHVVCDASSGAAGRTCDPVSF